VEWVGWAADVTDRVHAQEAREELEADLAGERQALEQVVSQAPAAIAVRFRSSLRPATRQGPSPAVTASGRSPSGSTGCSSEPTVAIESRYFTQA